MGRHSELGSASSRYGRRAPGRYEIPQQPDPTSCIQETAFLAIEQKGEGPGPACTALEVTRIPSPMLARQIRHPSFGSQEDGIIV